MLPWLLCLALALALLILLVKHCLLRKSLREITGQLAARLQQDTNCPIFLSSRDPNAMRLAAELNTQLKALRRLRQQYEGGDRALKEAVTNISHDLRTPLTAISGYLELLERQNCDPNAARYLSLIGDRAQAMIQLIEELLHYSVARSGEDTLHWEPVDLNKALEESVAGFYAAFTNRGIVPAVHMPETRVLRTLDTAALSRVLGNLLSNALKYSSGDLEITLAPDGTIAFANSAPELDEVQAGRLFDRFFTVEAARPSTGLGLSIAKTLVEQMDGQIQAQYELGRLTISIHFPAMT